MPLLVIFFAVIFFVFWNTFIAMANVWENSENFSHGWLIVPISLWLLWKIEPKVGANSFKPSWIGGVAVALLIALWIAGELARVSVVKQVAVVLMLSASVLLFAGWTVLKRVLFPMLFLLCMVPAGEGLTPFLMEQTATVTVWAIKLVGIPIYREGMHFALPTGRWSVIEACSGLRYFIAAVILALLFVYLNFKSWSRIVIFLVACIVLSIVANWMRAFLIVLVGHFSQMRYGVGDDHIVYGWVFFGVVMALVFWVGGKFGDKTELQTSENSHFKLRDFLVLPKDLKTYLVFVIGSLALIAGASMPSKLMNFAPAPASVETLSSGLGLAKTDQFVIPTAFNEPAASAFGRFNSGTRLEVKYFARQDKSKDMLAYGQRLMDEVSSDFVELEKATNSSLKLDIGWANRHVVRVQSDRWVLLHWFMVGKYSVSSPYLAKALRLISLLKGEGDHSYSVVVATKIGQQSELDPQALQVDANRVLEEFKAVTKAF
jgi:exosortase A